MNPPPRPSPRAGPVIPTERESPLARESARRLALLGNEGVRVHLEGGKEVELPAPAVQVLLLALEHMAAGDAVSVTPVPPELSVRAAAELLGVSLQFLTTELDNGMVPSRMVGTHRRIALVDLIAYRDAMAARRHAALDELTGQAQDLHMGY